MSVKRIDSIQEDDLKYISPQKAVKMLNITHRTLQNWDKQSKITCIRTKGGHRRVLLSDIIIRMKQIESKPISLVKNNKICYFRVSSLNQQDELKSQLEAMKQKYPTHEIIYDIGLTINSQRPNFNKLIDNILEGNITELVISSKNQLVLFGYNIIEKLMKKNGSIIEDSSLERIDINKDLFSELMSFLTLLSGRFPKLRTPTLRTLLKSYMSETTDDQIDICLQSEY